MRMVFIALALFSALPLLSAENEQRIFKELLHSSENAYALATDQLGKYPGKLNALTNRIQNDQRVILKTLRDTARAENIKLPEKSFPLPLRVSQAEYIEREIQIHERMLKLIEESSSPVLQNMIPRIKTILTNARRMKAQSIQAEEERKPENIP